MLFKRTQWLACLCIVVVTTASASLSIAQLSPDESLKNFMTSDVIGVAYVDIENMDLDESVALLAKLGFRETMQYQQIVDQLPEAKRDVAKLKEAGLSRAYALLRSSDIGELGTSFVMPLSTGSDPQPAIDAIKEVVVKLSGSTQPTYEIDQRDGALIASSVAQFDRLKNEKGEGNFDRSEMWNAIGKGSFGIVVFGDEDSRRVVRELMPELPPPFDSLNGELIANGTKWIGLSLKLDATPALNIEIETSDEKSAMAYETILKNALKLAKSMPQVTDVIPKAEIKFVFDAIEPARDGNRISISASQLTNDLDRLAKVLAPHVRAVRQAAVQTQLMNTVRQHALGLLNYESANRHFPTQYSVDEEGQPLLSWRVHVLPFLEQNELYKQFNLEEPWNSDHNIKLVEKMPQVFWDMRAGSLKANQAGKTIFQVPAGEGLVFDAAVEKGFRDLTDGSSNTISVVAMPIEHAVPWTKPIDWNVDLKNPLEKLEAEGKTRFVVALCDGSVHAVPMTIAKDDLRKLIDPQDGEIVERNTLD